jgi:hypothetical protein
MHYAHTLLAVCPEEAAPEVVKPIELGPNEPIRQLAEFHDRYADDLQIIVAANDVPDFIEEGDFVRLRLSERDRFVPPPDEDEENDGSQTSPEEAAGGGSPGEEEEA